MPDRDLCFTPATELARLYRARKVSPLEVMQAVLARIDAVNPRVNAYVTLARESALAAARRATAALRRRARAPAALRDSGVDQGPQCHQGHPHDLGLEDLRALIPSEDALDVARLKAAGAIVVGKTNTPEFGAGGNTFNAVFGATGTPGTRR